MAIRVYPALHPVVNFRREETPCLAHALTKRVGGDSAISSHLLDGSVVNAEHAPDLAGVDEVFNCFLSRKGPKV